MTIKKPLLLEIFCLAIVVATLHYVATTLSLYWSIEWFDIMMHFLGGLLAGLIALYLFFTSGYIRYPSDHKIIVLSVVIAAVLIVGLTWELWELFAGFSDVLKDRTDTLVDLGMDVLGAITSYYYGRNKIWRAR